MDSAEPGASSGLRMGLCWAGVGGRKANGRVSSGGNELTRISWALWLLGTEGMNEEREGGEEMKG